MAALSRQGALILDGGLATELERHGADLGHELWSARMLLENPDLIRQAHLAFLRAGADVIVTASYQASLEGFQRAGLSGEQARQAMLLSVALACEAREAFLNERAGQGRLRPLVAASIGPYGACLMDGSEYSGDYPLNKRQLIDFHRPRMEILARSGADILAIETIPSLLEAQALLELLREFPTVQAWLSFSCRDGLHVSHGETFAQGARLAVASPQVEA
ncbi:MAG: homocysteine S-methyltransferase, partial [Xanthomonadales bacterium]|nr:homocysteine S-methyltransferase [Xanthomonadales bacterium]